MYVHVNDGSQFKFVVTNHQRVHQSNTMWMIMSPTTSTTVQVNGVLLFLISKISIRMCNQWKREAWELALEYTLLHFIMYMTYVIHLIVALLLEPGASEFWPLLLMDASLVWMVWTWKSPIVFHIRSQLSCYFLFGLELLSCNGWPDLVMHI